MEEELELQEQLIIEEKEESNELEELDIYTEEGIEEFVDDDSITPSEQ
jgi:hypothetical protein